MKPGVETSVGVFEFTVTDEMTARLGELVLHPVYATFWCGYHAEVASRLAIEPYFEDHENAVGTALCLRHLAMAAVGAEIRVEARVSQVEGRRIRCDVAVMAVKTQTLLAEGYQDQVVLRTGVLEEKLANAVR